MSELRHFDGETTYIRLPLSSPTNQGGAITVEFWNYVKRTEAQKSYAFSFQFQGKGQTGDRISCHAPWSPWLDLFWDCGKIDGGGRLHRDYQSYFDKWTHVALVSAGAGTPGYQAIYLNGDVVEERHGSQQPPAFDELLIGADRENDGITRHHKGWMDGFRVWSVVRSNEEIQQNMKRRMSGAEENLVTCFSFSVDALPANLENKVSAAPAGALHGFSLGGPQPPEAVPLGDPLPAGAEYTANQKVEVYIGDLKTWVEGTYVDKVNYSNMQETPYKVTYTSTTTKGTKFVSAAEIRPWTGKLKLPVSPRVEPSEVNTQALETAIIQEVNRMRQDPGAYAKKLADLKSQYVYVENRYWYLNMPEEGGIYIGDQEAKLDHLKWLDETIAALRAVSSLSELKPNQELRKAADLFASDPGKVNGPEHEDSQGRGAAARARLEGYTGGMNECIPGDMRTAFGTVAQLLIDWKVQSRGHRKNLMNPANKDIGVACKYWPPTGQVDSYIRTTIQCGYGEV